ncbi:MAG: efflux transporter periplasmic adaptor subunit [unclassified Hahellaceae]|nr:efflux transporter periplasmic adaptor subunit [Hahellaceae bacterium]|tara:strand:+ start:68572 stop:69756 length:1185 start_codon:yes stop_codon:yes gene_type:complete
MSTSKLLSPGRAWIPVLIGIIVLMTLLYRYSPEADQHPVLKQVPEFTTVVVQAQNLRLDLHSQGIAAASRQVSLAMETGGRVIDVAPEFKSGHWVKAGTPLLQLDPEPFSLEIAQHKHQLDAAKLHLEEVRATAVVAQRLAASKANDFALRKPQLAEAESRVRSAKAALRMAERQLEQATLKAPFTGRLVDVSLAEGQYLRAGEPLGTIYSADEMVLRLPIQDAGLQLLSLPIQLQAVPLDIPVKLSGSFGGKRHTWDGSIRRREGGLNANRMTWLIAEVTLDSGDPPLEPGVYVEVLITGRLVEDLVALPRSALVNDSHVWVIGSEQVLSRRPVEWLHRDEQNVYVTSGLEPGEQVLRRGHSHLLEGTPARSIPKEALINADDALTAGAATAQ